MGYCIGKTNENNEVKVEYKCLSSLGKNDKDTDRSELYKWLALCRGNLQYTLFRYIIKTKTKLSLAHFHLFQRMKLLLPSPALANQHFNYLLAHLCSHLCFRDPPTSPVVQPSHLKQNHRHPFTCWPQRSTSPPHTTPTFIFHTGWKNVYPSLGGSRGYTYSLSLSTYHIH